MKKYDVVVAGGGPGGFGAALGAAKAGKKVLLFDRNGGPGGVAVFCGCPVFAGMPSFDAETVGGAAGELAAALEGHGTIIGNWTLNTTEFEAELAMSRLLRAAGVDLLFYSVLTGARCENGRIGSVTLSCCGRNMELEADSFVDATGDAVLSVLAGAKTVAGTPEETMTKTVLFRVGGVGHFDKPKLMELFKTLDFPFSYQDRFMGTPVGDGSEILLNLTAVSGDALDPFDLTRMDIELRDQIPIVLDWMREKLPGFSRCRLTAVAPVIGVRGSRNIVGRENITCEDLDRNTPVPEAVAVGKRSYGEHYIHTFESPWRKSHAGFRAVPYGALLPVGIDNLAVAGRCVGVEPRAISAIRLMPVCIATGQAAGIAAALGFPDYETLKMELCRQKCKWERGS